MANISPATLLSRRFPAKRAFITGAASGLGLAMAADAGPRRLDARRARRRPRGAGACRRAVARRRVRRRSLPIPATSPRTSSSPRPSPASRRRTGGLDVMVNNAGRGRGRRGRSHAGRRTGTGSSASTCSGVVWGCRAALPVMKRQRQRADPQHREFRGFCGGAADVRLQRHQGRRDRAERDAGGELAGTGLQVSCAMPGFFRTHLLDHMRAPPEENRLAHRIMDNSGHDPDEAALGAARRSRGAASSTSSGRRNTAGRGA